MVHSGDIVRHQSCLVSPKTEQPEKLAELSLTREGWLKGCSVKVCDNKGIGSNTYPDLRPLAGAERAVRALEGTGPSMGPFVTLHLSSAIEGLGTDLAGKLL